MMDFIRKGLENIRGKGKLELISLHIPKTAGTSFRNTLKAIYGDEAVVRLDIYDPHRGAERVQINQEVYPQSYFPKSAKVIHGHFKLKDLHHFFDVPEEVPMITWLRDPVERVISNYYYLVQRLSDEVDKLGANRNLLRRMQRTLIEFARDEENRDRMSKFLSGVELEKLAFVGIQEHYSEDLSTLAQQLGWNMVTEFKYNITPKKYAVSAAD